MNAAAIKDLDLSVLPPDYRAAFEALQATAARVAALEEINKRLEHLVAELNHVVHGKKSEKLSEDDRQLAFEELTIAVFEAEEQKCQTAPANDKPKRKSVAKRNRGNLPENLPRIEQVVEPEILVCSCGCGSPLSLGPMALQRRLHKIGEDRTERLDIVPAQLCVIRCPAMHVYMHERGHRALQICVPGLYRWRHPGACTGGSDRGRAGD